MRNLFLIICNYTLKRFITCKFYFYYFVVSAYSSAIFRIFQCRRFRRRKNRTPRAVPANIIIRQGIVKLSFPVHQPRSLSLYGSRVVSAFLAHLDRSQTRQN